MTEAATAVALLFDDGELGAQLRAALQDRGAQIVHEGGIADLDRALLNRLDADVLVINLDGAAEEALEGLYDMLEGDRPRVVFNDAQASRSLSGWDRARWARHLAAKVLFSDEVDPPRPAGSRGLEAHAVVVAMEGEAAPMATSAQATPFPAESATDEMAIVTPVAPEMEAGATSESLAAELEALLASDELPEEDEETSAGLRYAESDELPPLHDGNFGDAPTGQATLSRPEISVEAESPTPAPSAAESRVFQLDHLQLSPLAEAAGLEAGGVLSPVIVDTPEKAASWLAPASWALMDDALVIEKVVASVGGGSEAETPSSSEFGIQKMSAADFLAPEGSSEPADEDPVMSLELVSIEEAIAPQPYQDEGGREIVLDMDGSALRRIVLVGVAEEGEKSLIEFLGALPTDIPLAFLLIQHADEQASPARLERLAAHSAIPVRWAEDNGLAVIGEVRIVPVGYAARLTRDGRIQLQPSLADARMSPSIDVGFTMAANVFGRDALGIVMGGRSNDAIGGAQAIHDRGGQVWVEADDDYVTDMVRALFAERLVSFSGDASALAAHLVEVFS